MTRQEAYQIMQHITGEVGFARSNDGLLFRACSAHGVIPGVSSGFPFPISGHAEENKKCLTIEVVLPEETSVLSREELFVFATMAESDHWRDVDFPTNCACGGWSSAGNLDMYKNTRGQWVITLKFCNWSENERKASVCVVYQLITAPIYTRTPIGTRIILGENM